ncbi:MAG: nitrate reductase subunit alpha [Propionibacteriaceae bacterium]|jgi:nitrate reductase alpha subunit|nr:nitrate reductase subunit alpha [Propionibacteriaceae bacterium]
MDGPSPAVRALLKGRALVTREDIAADGRTTTRAASDGWERFYRDRYAHDKVVTTTHGVNCTGSCSWRVFVKDGLIAWEHQNPDYPTPGEDCPEYEPRGCPRGASFSWYTYSPARVRHPYIRGRLLEFYRAQRAQGRDPVQAWAAIVADPGRCQDYKSLRGKGGFVRAGWDEALELMAAAHVHTVKAFGPDRCLGFSPIPAMSMVSFCAGTRFFSLLGGTLLSFYDWYCDLPPASPQIWGDQTDVPESADWFNAGHIILWGANVPVTRTPDAHFLTEVRYKGTKVVAISPDYAESVKFADDWLAPRPGTDGALAQAMGHVILAECFRDRQVDHFDQYVRRFTDLPFLVRLEPAGQGRFRPGKFLTAEDLPPLADQANAAFKPVLLDRGRRAAVAPPGTLGDRWGEAGLGRWNLDLGAIDPALSAADLAPGGVVAAGGAEKGVAPGSAGVAGPGPAAPGGTGATDASAGPDALGGTGATGDVGSTSLTDAPGNVGDMGSTGAVGDAGTVGDTPGAPADWGGPVMVELPRFDQPADGDKGGSMVRGAPTLLVGGVRVTTVFDLMLAAYGVARPGLPGDWPRDYDDPSAPATPGWAEAHSGVKAGDIIKVARQFAANAEQTRGRSMIILGAGTNHYFHSDTIYRDIIALLLLTGCQGVNGGGWAHYVGQEKARPITGQQHIGFALDWARPPRHQAATAFWYLHSDQWRHDLFQAGDIASPTGAGRLPKTTPDCLAQAVRSGWTPGHPGFNRNPLDLADEARAAGLEPGPHIVAQLKSGALRFAVEDPDDPANFPRTLTLWRANLLGNSAKGSEYFLRHLLGADSAVTAPELPPADRPKDVVWRDQAPQGKLDLVTTIDFRMTGSALLSDVVLPAATWYEKHDISTTDMHPFIHAFNPAIAPPWEARTDYQIFSDLADRVSELARDHLGTRTDVIPVPLLTDTPDELAQPHGVARDWKRGQCQPVPGVTMPKLVVQERDYTALGRKLRSLGPLIGRLGTTTKGVTTPGADPVAFLARHNGVDDQGRPRLDTDVKLAEAILALSGTTNGQVAQAGFRALEARVGQPLADMVGENAERRISFADTQAGPTPVFTSPEWSGVETGGRRYSPFCINTERLRPWSTLTGRQHFYLDHDWLTELGEALPVYRPPLDLAHYAPDAPGSAGVGLRLRYLTPHDKWAIHSSYADNPYMLALSRGGPTIWLSEADAAALAVADNDWVEAENQHGVVVARAVVSQRLPAGTVFMYHAKDRNIDVPLTEANGRRGGIHNALTRLYVKPTHLAGGYAQLTYGFNYYGATGNQRDELVYLRRRSQQVDYGDVGRAPKRAGAGLAEAKEAVDGRGPEHGDAGRAPRRWGRLWSRGGGTG